MKDFNEIKICIVGAGPAGLCVAKNLLTSNFKPVVLEKTPHLGGTWVYNEEITYDGHGLPMHTAMYNSLRTNLPKQVMCFSDSPMSDVTPCYPTRKDVLSFLENYSNTNDVIKHIKLNHFVKHIKSEGKGWSVTYVDLTKNQEDTEVFDYVFVCSGAQFSTPFIPDIEGIDTFKGGVIHSHDYRIPEPFKDKRVLVLGEGFSGLDIGREISTVSKMVVLSYLIKKPESVFADNLEYKPKVQNVYDNKVTFIDGTSEEIDHIVYCTGFTYNFPFLDPSCGIKVDKNYVQPLYKQMINIEHPTMFLIGVPQYVCAFQLFDLQARYCVKAIKGDFELPTKKQMYDAMNAEFDEITSEGSDKSKIHCIGKRQNEFYNSIADESGIDRLPPVLVKLTDKSIDNLVEDIGNFRSKVFHIINDEEFIVE